MIFKNGQKTESAIYVETESEAVRVQQEGVAGYRRQFVF
jgi:hypothetical protein